MTRITRLPPDSAASHAAPLRAPGSARPAPTAALALAAAMAASGISHFLAPRPYEQIVPHFLGSAGLWVRLSGGAEIGCAVLLLFRRTRSLGGWLSAGLLVAVFPANVQMALDGGLAGRGFPLGSPVVAWLRLPLQVPLVAWARAVALRARR
ncbi:MAG: hypothetical protein M3011_11805 [Actinomycetota bacterium]|nr:hypothetical protein [Actinomycetota bacterium]